jgi:glycosyltransferase involved in cell wall biosynthesis
MIYRLPPERFRVTYNVFDPGLLTATRTPDSVRAELGVGPGDFVVGTVANLKPWKRTERLIDAAAAISAAEVRVLIVGDGQDRSRLEERARRLGLASSVIFAGLRESPADYLRAMDAFCLPSMGLESFGNAAVEAMALGIPTIVFSDGGGLVEHIERGKTGFVVDDQAELEKTLRALINEPELRHRVGVGGSAAVRTRYAPARSAEAFRALYADALQEAAPHSGERRVAHEARAT